MSQVSTAVQAVQQKLSVCQEGKAAIDAAKQAYDAAVVLLDAATNAMDNAGKIVDQIADIVEQRINDRIDAAVALGDSVVDLMDTIENLGDVVKGKDPLDACIAVQDVISTSAQKANSIKGQVDSITDLHNQSLTQLAQATEVFETNKRAYDDAKNGVETALNAVINIGNILGRH